MPGASDAPPARDVDARTALVAVAGAAAVLAALWLLDLYVLQTRVLTLFRGLLALTPMYAFWNPLVRPSAVAFVAAAAVTVAVAPALVDPARTPRWAYLALLSVLALVLPWTLFLVRQPTGMLGTQFVVYPGEEFIADADRIGSLPAFVSHYVELMHTGALSRHGAHFPPGHATLLYLVRVAFGPGVFRAGVTVLVLAALALPVAFLAMRTIRAERTARTGAVLLLACPSLLDYACTSMDAVFLLVAGLAWWASLAAFAPDGTAARALGAGALLLVSTLFSFSTFPLGLAVLVYASLRARRSPAHVARQLALAGAAYVAAALATYAATGFPIWDCVHEARASGVALMAHITARSPAASWGHLSYGNLAAFLIGSGVAIVAAAATATRAGAARDPWTIAGTATILVMALGGLYFMETERIWLFAIPWLAAIAVTNQTFTPPALRILVGAGLLQTFLMETLLYTLW